MVIECFNLLWKEGAGRGGGRKGESGESGEEGKGRNEQKPDHFCSQRHYRLVWPHEQRTKQTAKVAWCVNSISVKLLQRSRNDCRNPTGKNYHR